MTRRLAWLTGPVVALAVAALVTATFGSAATLGVSSAHLTILHGPVASSGGPGDPDCPVGAPVGDRCQLTLVGGSHDMYFAGQTNAARVDDTGTLEVNPHTSGGSGSANHRQAFILFEALDGIPDGAQVDVADLTMVRHTSNPMASDRTYEAQPAAASWTAPGDGRPGVVGPVAASSSTDTNVTWDLVDAVQDFVDSERPNHGWRIVDEGSGNQLTQFRSSRYSDPDQRPRLIVVYELPGTP